MNEKQDVNVGLQQHMKVVDRVIKDLIHAEYNPRKINDKQFSDLKKSLKKYGFVDPVIVNIHPERLNVIVGGHQRTKAWESLGNDVVPTVQVNLTLADEMELNVRLNKNSGEFDVSLLNEFYERKKLIEIGFSSQELEDRKKELEDATDRDDSEPDYPIVPEMSEKYDYVIVFARNEIETNFLDNWFDLERELSYKNSGVGIGHVVDFEKFKSLLKAKNIGVGDLEIGE